MTKNREPIYVVGYPRSGNTWLSRLLGDMLQSPVDGYKEAKPLATEGQERPGHYVVRQLHLKPVHTPVEDGLTANEINVDTWPGGKIVFVTRDPRDVAVSAMYYWNIKTIQNTLVAMGEGSHPLGGSGSWQSYIKSWRDTTIGVAWTCYENLYFNGVQELGHILTSLELPSIEEDEIVKTLARQEITKKRTQINMDGDGRPYGKTIQLKHLRKGEVGDWRSHFSKDDCALAQKYFGEQMMMLGYTTNEYWYLEGI